MPSNFKFPLNPLRFFTQNKRSHWPRIIYPALACAVVIYQENLYERYTINRFAEISFVSLTSGGLFYYFYYYTIHKLIRVVTHRWCGGLPTYQVVIDVLRKNNLDQVASNIFEVQVILGGFFRRNSMLRSNDLVLRNSIFHGIYMICIIGFGYSCFKFCMQPSLIWSLSALCAFVVFIVGMWLDKKYGELEESLILRRNEWRLVEYLQSFYGNSNS